MSIFYNHLESSAVADLVINWQKHGKKGYLTYKEQWWESREKVLEPNGHSQLSMEWLVLSGWKWRPETARLHRKLPFLRALLGKMIRELERSGVPQRRKVLPERCHICPAPHRVLWLAPDTTGLLACWSLCKAKLEKSFLVHFIWPFLCSAFGSTGKEMVTEGKTLETAVRIAGSSTNNF